MTNRRVLLLAVSVLMVALGLPIGFGISVDAEKLPPRLTDHEFWRLASEFSEPDGTFHSENLVSNEARFQSVIPELVRTAMPGRAYVGVGSEQNFTYIAALVPAMAFIVDIRRGNMDLHLVYKALFEMSTDRAEFVSRLFSRTRPAGLNAMSTAGTIFDAYEKAPPSQALYDENLKAIKALLVRKHGFTLSSGDLTGIDFVYSSWFNAGPDLRYELNGGGGFRRNGGFPTYATLMTATDGTGRNRSFLASEEAFTFLKDMETRNMIVPVVGNFGGNKALRAVATYLKQKDAIVSAFYTSNVEQYLRQDHIWSNFCANAATMPVDATSMFIRSARGGFVGQPGGFLNGTPGGGFTADLAPMMPEVASCATAR